MTSNPSTSTENSSTERSSSLQRNRTQGGIIRIQKQTAGTSKTWNSTKTQTEEKILSHPLFSIVKLLLKKCENAATLFDKESFEIEDVKNLFHDLDESSVQLNSEKDEVDILMETAVLALRQCMVEMERVFVLSDRFKTKYLAVLRRTVCHEALVGNGGDSDDDLSESPLMLPLPGDSQGPPENVLQESRKLMESAYATLQNSSNGPLAFPFQFLQHPMMLSPTQLQRNFEFLRQFGFIPPLVPTSLDASTSLCSTTVPNPPAAEVILNKSPEKSEEEKSIRNS